MEKSLQTKMELVSSFKEILKTVPFRKIVISQISGNAGMSRKSFYYHFEDKYDLVKWIFEYEFVRPMKEKQISGYLCLEKMCHYLYSQRTYYRQVLFIAEQNSLSEYLNTYIQQQIFEELRGKENATIKSVFMSDAILVMVKRWLRDVEDMNSHEFVCQLCDLFFQGNVTAVIPAENKYAAV